MMLYRIASALFGYPDAALRAALPAILETVGEDEALMPEERTLLTGFCERMLACDALQAEEDYVNTFDMVPEHSLHLTHHLIGEDKNRGPALIDLSEFYRAHGLDIREKELPDYLPLLLEFVSVLAPANGQSFLAGWHKVLRQLQVNLADAQSPYADLVGLIEARCRPTGSQAEAMTAVSAASRSTPCLDDGDFHPEVNWSAPAACATPPAPGVRPVHFHERRTEFAQSGAVQAGQNETHVRR